MSIQWDAMLARATGVALQERLGGARLRSVFFDYGDRSVALFFREATLVWRLHPARGDLAVLEPADPLPGARPLPAHLTGTSVPPDDRIVRLHFRRLRGRPARLDLVVELLPNAWNALLVEPGEGVIRHVLRPRERGARVLRPGSVYQPPPASDRIGADGPVEIGEWVRALAVSDASELRRTLLRTIAYSSSLNAPAILGATEHAPDSSGGALSGGEHGSVEALPDLDAAYRAWRRLRDPGGGPPCVLAARHGPQPYPVALSHLESEPATTLLEAFQRAVESESGQRVTPLVPSDVLVGLEAAVERANRRVTELTRQRDKTPEPEALRAEADLLLARLGQVRQGMESVELSGFDGRPVRIELDAALSPAENADRLYDRAGKAERARARIPVLLGEAHERAAELDRLLARARAGEASMEEMIPFARTGPDRARGAGAQALAPYRKYLSSGGLEIRVGRGARWNDELTFKNSAPDDVWLHARHASGAHVVLRWQQDDNPPARDLEEAAILAALHSTARTSANVPVDWTRRKHVRKPRKAPRGTVVLEREKTLFVTPDAALAERLRVRED